MTRFSRSGRGRCRRTIPGGVGLAILIWLFTAGWLVVAIQAFRDMWRISRIRFAAILILVALVLSIASALVLFAGTL